MVSIFLDRLNLEGDLIEHSIWFQKNTNWLKKGDLYYRKGMFCEAINCYDQGADLVIEQYGKRTMVQTKRRKGNIGNSAIQEVFAAKRYYDTTNALVVTVSDFTKPVRELAEKLEIELWDRKKLLLEIGKTY